MSSLTRSQPNRPVAPQGDVNLAELSTETGHGKSRATICLEDEKGWRWDDVAFGNGPVDAAVKAINRRLGLEGMRLAGVSVTSKDGEKGSESVALATVKVSFSHKRDNGPESSETTAKAEDLDMVKATVLAYVSAINILRKEIEVKA